MENKLIKVGITQGDINGIGYEVIIKSLMDQRMHEICTPVVYGSPKVAAYHRKALNIDNFSFNTIRTASEANDKRPNIINCVSEDIRVELGKSTSMAGEASYLALEAAVTDLKKGLIDVLVTGPINKKNIQSERFHFSGHTEYLQSVFSSGEVLMLMVSDHLKVGVVAGHIPVGELTSYITHEKVISKIRVMNESLKKDFGIRKPKIAVFGLNPHAGDEGVLGQEEIKVIGPAIAEAKNEGIYAFGPYPADGFFSSGNQYKFDAILAMFHDQGLIPFKTIVQDEGVNFTAGLPIVRTSPAHGTAYEMAGKDEAHIGSFRASIYTACDIYRNRQYFEEVNQDPLPAGLPEEVKGTREQPGE